MNRTTRDDPDKMCIEKGRKTRSIELLAFAYKGSPLVAHLITSLVEVSLNRSGLAQSELNSRAVTSTPGSGQERGQVEGGLH